MENTKNIKLLDKEFKPFLSEQEIEEAIEKIAIKINADYKNKDVLVIAILNGSFIFVADLVRKFKFSNTISFVKVASYEGLASSGTVKKIIGLMDSLEGRDVIIVEDIVDTGNTLSKLLPTFLVENPKSLKLCTLLYKPDAFEGDFKIDYIAKEISNKFIVGYGLDYDGYGRHLPDIYQIV